MAFAKDFKLELCLFCSMKKWILFIVIATSYYSAQAQAETLPPFRRFPTTPPLKLLLQDSVTHFTEKNLKKNQALLVDFFSPDCDHCLVATENMISHMDKLKDVQIVMVTTISFQGMKAFIQKYQLDQYKNITVGFDYSFIVPTFFRIKNFPFLALYDKKGNLINAFDGGLPVEKLVEIFSK
jgi:thiol-disulfide isomerase/thioredoxin